MDSLAESLRRADPGAFWKFYEHYLPRVLGFARRRCADEKAARALTEAILDEAVRGLPGLAPGASLDEALLAAARRVASRPPGRR